MIDDTDAHEPCDEDQQEDQVAPVPRQRDGEDEPWSGRTVADAADAPDIATSAQERQGGREG